MDIKQYIQLCAVKRGGITQRKLAEMIGTTPQNLGDRLRQNRLNMTQLEKIAEAFDADLKVTFLDKSTGEPII